MFLPLTESKAVFSSRLFWKLFLVYALLSAVTAASVITILSHRLHEIAFKPESHRVHDSATTMVGLLDGSFERTRHGNLTETVTTIAAENRTRITLVKDDGVVVDDSERKPFTMENHAERPEVVQASQTGTGSAQRLSPPLGIRCTLLFEWATNQFPTATSRCQFL